MMTSKKSLIIAPVILLLSVPALAQQPDAGVGLLSHVNIVHHATPLITPAIVAGGRSSFSRVASQVRYLGLAATPNLRATYEISI